MEPLISIIVPVYNTELYLERCVNSLLNQTLEAIEIVLVDDKTKDSSGRICDDIAKQDERVIVVHKDQNEGLGFARNTGLVFAKGKYILFVDSDDYVDLELCQKAMNRIIECEADVCYFGHKRDINGKIIESDLSFLKDTYEGNAIIEDFLKNTIAQAENKSGPPKIGMSAWRILYDASLFQSGKLQFYSEREYLNEDLFFRIALSKQIRKVAVLKENLYYYCFNSSSLTIHYREDRFEASKRMYDKLIEETVFCNSPEMHKRCQRAFMNNLLVCIRQEVKNEKEKGIKSYGRIKTYCCDSLVKRILSEYPIRKMPFSSRVLYNAVNKKWVRVVVLLVNLKNRIGS